MIEEYCSYLVAQVQDLYSKLFYVVFKLIIDFKKTLHPYCYWWPTILIILLIVEC